jgi:hypothetical protein
MVTKKSQILMEKNHGELNQSQNSSSGPFKAFDRHKTCERRKNKDGV